MLKVLLVDDEFLVRMAFSNTIDWKEHGFDFIGTASNGVEAFDMILNERPDIVITDLTMPQMGGLELIEKVHEANVKCEFVVLSCHNEFEYARQSMKMGVFDYILKLSMDRKELEDILERLKKKILTERENSSREVRTMEVLEQQDLEHERFRVIVFHGGYSERGGQDKGNAQIMGFVRQMTEGIVNKSVFEYKNMPILLLWERCKDLKQLLEEIQTEIEKYLDCGTSIGIGCEVLGNRHIRDSFESALHACGHRFYLGEKAICAFNDYQYRELKTIDFCSIFPGMKESLRIGIGKETRSCMIHALDHLLETKDVEPEEVRMYLHEFLMRIKLRANEQKEGVITEEMYGDIYQKVNQLDYLEGIRDDMIYFIDQVLEPLDLADENELVQSAKKYVHSHLKEDLRVMEVSRQLGVNPDYFSHLFRTETGIRYIDYVNQVRIERACERLKLTNDKIYEIGEQCGFENTNYFIKVFKKHTGLTPLDYKKSQNEIRPGGI